MKRADPRGPRCRRMYGLNAPSCTRAMMCWDRHSARETSIKRPLGACPRSAWGLAEIRLSSFVLLVQFFFFTIKGAFIQQSR